MTQEFGSGSTAALLQKLVAVVLGCRGQRPDRGSREGLWNHASRFSVTACTRALQVGRNFRAATPLVAPARGRGYATASRLTSGSAPPYWIERPEVRGPPSEHCVGAQDDGER